MPALEGWRYVLGRILPVLRWTVYVCGLGPLLPLALVAETAARYSLSGLEFASGIPGSLGGGVYVNAGSYGGEMKDVVVAAEVYQPGTGFATLNREELKLGYRTSVLQETGGILVEAVLQLTPGDEATIRAQMKTLNAKRRTKQPLEYPSAGSVFKRPEGAFAGQLIEAAGLKGTPDWSGSSLTKTCRFHC